MKNHVLKIAGVLALAVSFTALSGCRTSSRPYQQPWYDVYGYHCGSGAPRPGCNFYGDGRKVMDYNDPYYSTYNEYQYGWWDYSNSYGYREYYYGWAWLSHTGILYDEWGYALNEEGQQEGRDLIGDVARKEEEVIVGAGKRFARKHALADATGVQIARTLNDWATLAKKQKRARTEQDIADFSKRLYGVSLSQTTVALDKAKAGDLSGLEAVNTEIASFWGTSPETSKSILKNWYKDQLDEHGAK